MSLQGITETELDQVEEEVWGTLDDLRFDGASRDTRADRTIPIQVHGRDYDIEVLDESLDLSDDEKVQEITAYAQSVVTELYEQEFCGR